MDQHPLHGVELAGSDIGGHELMQALSEDALFLAVKTFSGARCLDFFEHEGWSHQLSQGDEIPAHVKVSLDAALDFAGVARRPRDGDLVSLLNAGDHDADVGQKTSSEPSRLGCLSLGAEGVALSLEWKERIFLWERWR